MHEIVLVFFLLYFAVLTLSTSKLNVCTSWVLLLIIHKALHYKGFWKKKYLRNLGTFVVKSFHSPFAGNSSSTSNTENPKFNHTSLVGDSVIRNFNISVAEITCVGVLVIDGMLPSLLRNRLFDCLLKIMIQPVCSVIGGFHIFNEVGS